MYPSILSADKIEGDEHVIQVDDALTSLLNKHQEYIYKENDARLSFNIMSSRFQRTFNLNLYTKGIPSPMTDIGAMVTSFGVAISTIRLHETKASPTPLLH